MPITQSKAKAAVIESGRVIDVDIDTYTLSVTTQFTKKPQSGVSFATPYQHFAEGEGIYFMPEVGSLCWVCFPSDGSRPFVLSWAAASDEGNFKSKKMDLNPGDIYLGTRDGNFLILRRGGVLQIGGGPLAQRMYLPINNTIRDFCENYKLHTLGGDLEWTIKREENTTDGKRPASLRVHAREFANDPKPVAELEIGSHQGDEATILSLNIKASGETGADRKISLSFTKEGNAVWDVQQDVSWTVKRNFSLSAEEDVAIEAGTTLQLNGETVEATSSGDMNLKSNTGTLTLEAAQLVDVVGRMRVGGGSYPVIIAHPSFIAWLLGHTHGSAVGPTTPPVAPILTADHISKNLFTK